MILGDNFGAKNVIFVLKSYSSIFWVIKNEWFVGIEKKKLFKVLTCNIKSYSSNFSYGKKSNLRPKNYSCIICCYFVQSEKLFSNFWVESRKKNPKSYCHLKITIFLSKIIHEIVKIIFFWHRWWQILGARIGAKMVISG